MEKNASDPIRVILIDDNKHIRILARIVLKSEEDIEVCDEAESLRDVGRLLSQWQPDVFVIDIMLNEYDGDEKFLKQISSLNETGVKIIILSAHSESTYADQCLKAGAHGYVAKDKLNNCLALAIRNVYMGDKFVSSEVC